MKGCTTAKYFINLSPTDKTLAQMFKVFGKVFDKNIDITDKNSGMLFFY